MACSRTVGLVVTDLSEAGAAENGVTEDNERLSFERAVV